MASPRVTVSVWDKYGEQPALALERSSIPGGENLRNYALFGNDDARSVETLQGSAPSVSRDTQGSWVPDMGTGQRGLAPGSRPLGETSSANQLATARETNEKNEKVATWVSDTVDQISRQSPNDFITESVRRTTAEYDNVPTNDIPMGHTTVNKHVPDQVYYNTNPQEDCNAGPPTRGFNQTDWDSLPPRNWADAPMVQPISQSDSKRNQPETSQAAMSRFEMMCQDNASVISHAATWGTRRRSMPSVYDTEGVISGNFFKKLSLRGESSLRRPSLLKKIPSLVRRPSHSQLLKRKGSNEEEVADEPTSGIRRESRDSLAPPSRTPSWNKKKSTPSLNTAIVGMAAGAASIGASHARTGSISALSPKSPFGLTSAKNVLRRPRSKTEIPKTEASHPNLVGMMKRAGGPPAVQLPKSQIIMDQDDDDDDDDETFDDIDMKTEAGMVDDIIPTTDGFHQHILRLNPELAGTNQYLVERIAHQMVNRYKNLQNQKIKHLRAAHSGHCKSGAFCLEAGGAAVPLDIRGDARSLDPFSSRPPSSDGDITPLEGGLNGDSFPSGIPMPPTAVLPAVSIVFVPFPLDGQVATQYCESAELELTHDAGA